MNDGGLRAIPRRQNRNSEIKSAREEEDGKFLRTMGEMLRIEYTQVTCRGNTTAK